MMSSRAFTSSVVFEAAGIRSFHGFNLPDPLLQGLHSRMQFDRPSEIQAVSLPLICQPPFPSLIAQVKVLDVGSGRDV